MLISFFPDTSKFPTLFSDTSPSVSVDDSTKIVLVEFKYSNFVDSGSINYLINNLFISSSFCNVLSFTRLLVMTSHDVTDSFVV